MTQHFAQQAGVVIEDGSHYVQNGENYLRINFGTQRYWLEQSINRNAEALLIRNLTLMKKVLTLSMLAPVCFSWRAGGELRAG